MAPYSPTSVSRSRHLAALLAHAPRSGFLLTLFVALLLGLLSFSTPSLAQDSAEVRTRQQQMAERRVERQEAARERREQSNDPNFIRDKAWWNSEETVNVLELTGKQRKQADAELAKFLELRESLQENSRILKQEFFDALGSGAKDIQPKKQAMLDSMAASNLANANFRVAILALLNAEQLAYVRTSMPQILRSNWIRTSGPQQQMQRRSR